MTGWTETGENPRGVRRMLPGDHAFVSYEEDEGHWEVLSLFAQRGLARQEKVIVFPAPQLAEATVRDRMEAHLPSLAAAREGGQLTVSSMRDLISPDAAFTPERQWSRIQEETDRAVAEGYDGLRTYIDMHWVADLEADIEVMMYRESNAQHLFTGRPYSEICAYDRRQFSGDVLSAMRHSHPRELLSRAGQLAAAHAPGTVRLAGEADLATREQFTTALHRALAERPVGARLLVDLTQLDFLSTGCATELLLRLYDAPHEQIDLHCGSAHAALLHRLGAASLIRLAISEVTS